MVIIIATSLLIPTIGREPSPLTDRVKGEEKNHKRVSKQWKKQANNANGKPNVNIDKLYLSYDVLR